MAGKSWGEFEKYEWKLGNRCNELFMRWQKTFAKEKKVKNEQKT